MSVYSVFRFRTIYSRKWKVKSPQLLVSPVASFEGSLIYYSIYFFLIFFFSFPQITGNMYAVPTSLFSAFTVFLIVSHSLDGWFPYVLLPSHWIKCIWQRHRLNFTSAISIWLQLNIWWSSSLRIQMDLVSSMVNFKCSQILLSWFTSKQIINNRQLVSTLHNLTENWY